MPEIIEHENGQYWNAFLNRDKTFDGKFFVGVKSTGIYCKPSCPAKKPGFQSCQFFDTREDAVCAGFRACKRCHPELEKSSENFVVVFQQAISLLDENLESINSVQIWAEKAKVSMSLLRGAVKEVSGLSPRDFLINQKVEAFKKNIQSGENVTSALYSAGFGSSSRLYEKARLKLGMTPGNYKNGGNGVKILFTVLDTPYGFLLVAATLKGVCSIKFGNAETDLLQGLQEEFPQAELIPDTGELAPWVKVIQQYFKGYSGTLDIPLDLQASAFRQKVWAELRQIPFGETRSYSQVAAAIGQPTAVRAVASACGANPVAIVTPCHRVIHGDGSISGYRWGVERKKGLLESERIHSTRTIEN